MRYAFFLLLLVAVNCAAQKKSNPQKYTGAQEGHVNIPVFADACSYNGYIGSGVMTLISSQNPKEPLLLVNNEKGERIAYLNYDSTLVIIDTLATINQLIKHIYAQEKSLNLTTLQLIGVLAVNDKLVALNTKILEDQKKAWKELMDKLTVKK